MKYILATLLIIGCMAQASADILDASSVTVEKPSLRKYDYAGGSDVVYYGYNINPDASDGDTDWVIFKYTYTGSDVTQIERTTGDWTLRANHF